MIGWIKVSRSITDHWIWKDPIKLKWWIDMLITVNFKDNKINIGNQLIECNRGQSIMSLKQWADRWKVDKNKVRNFFVLLEKDGQILHENIYKTTRITICNYDSYNEVENAIKTQSKRNKNAIETQSNPIEEGKEGLNKEEKITNSPYGDGRLHFLTKKFSEENPGKYPKDFYVNFLQHWTAIIQNGAKKGKELWTDEKAFAISSRLATSYKITWESKNPKEVIQKIAIAPRATLKNLELTEEEKTEMRKASGLI